MTPTLHLCDVFAEGPLSGNSLTVVAHDAPIATSAMLAITRELRQFETIFLRPTTEPDRFEARIFSLARELQFAGHPMLGAASVLHGLHAPEDTARSWRLAIHGRDVHVSTARTAPARFLAEMDQAAPTFAAVADAEQTRGLLRALSLGDDDLAPGLAPAVVSTGLRYVVVPVRSGLAGARVVAPDLERLIAELDAEFAYVIDVEQREGRHWENDGSIEDIATGSAAGVVAAFLVRHGRAEPGERITLRQGRFLGRPSELLATVERSGSVKVAGPVALVAHGAFHPGAID